MNKLVRLMLPALLLGLSAAAGADGHGALIVTTPPAAADSNINLQTNTGSACAAQPVGNCGSCSVTCPTGHAAMCKPGLSVNNQPGASCVTPPECKCQ